MFGATIWCYTLRPWELIHHVPTHAMRTPPGRVGSQGRVTSRVKSEDLPHLRSCVWRFFTSRGFFAV
jgi:hypothetical protein